MVRIFGLLLFCMSFAATAKDLKLVTEQGQILVPEIAGWELGRDMFGMPFILFSPRANGQRSNISLTATGVDVEINLSEMAKNPDAYKVKKDQWAQSVGATVKRFVPYSSRRNVHDHQIHSIGIEYSHLDKDYVEMSHYINCRSRLIFVKSLRLKENVDHDQGFTRLISELDCGL